MGSISVWLQCATPNLKSVIEQTIDQTTDDILSRISTAVGMSKQYEESARYKSTAISCEIHIPERKLNISFTVPVIVLL